MATPPPSGKTLPASLASLQLDVLIDLLGRHGVEAVLRSAGLEGWIASSPRSIPGETVGFDQVAALQGGLADTLGRRGARGLALRMGSRVFEQLLQPVGAVAAMADPAFQAFPLDRRLRAGLHGVARTLDQIGPFGAQVIEGASLEFSIPVCPDCWGRSKGEVDCASVEGLVRSALRWIAPEVQAEVTETACRAQGAPACRFTIRIDSEPDAHG